MTDQQGGELPRDISAVTHGKPAFYTERELAPVRAKLEAHRRGEGYGLADGTQLVVGDAPFTSPGVVLRHVLTSVLTEATKNPAGYWLSDAEALSRQLEPLQADLTGKAVEMLAETLLILQATWANAGDNDYLRGLTGTERLLLDLEALAPGA